MYILFLKKKIEFQYDRQRTQEKIHQVLENGV